MILQKSELFIDGKPAKDMLAIERVKRFKKMVKQTLGRDIDDKTALQTIHRQDSAQIWVNPEYHVMQWTGSDANGVVHEPALKGLCDYLCIRGPHDWRKMQDIKNQLCGEAREAFEIYPAERRVIDDDDQYHLIVLPLGYKFPFGVFKQGQSLSSE